MQTAGLNKQEQRKKYWFSALPLTEGKLDASCVVASPLKFTFSSQEQRRGGAFPFFRGGSAVSWEAPARGELMGYSQLQSAKLVVPLKDMWDYEAKIRLVTGAA